VVIIATLVQRADHAEARADRAESQQADTKADLYLAEQRAEDAESAIADADAVVEATHQTLNDTVAELDRANAQVSRYAERSDACRAVVKVSDEMLNMSIASDKGFEHVLAGRRGHARDKLDDVQAHSDKIMALVQEAGFDSITALYDACTPGPPVWTKGAKQGQ